jgi:predicted GTPase
MGIARRGLKVAVLRHPMPYGDLARQAVQRFATPADLDAANVTIEEREEYEPWIEAGIAVHAGVDYAAILAAAESEADILVWDGGNNDTPFLRPDLHIVLADALRPGHETFYWPGEANLRMADVVVIAKCDAAKPADIEAVRLACRQAAPGAKILRGGSPIRLDNPDGIRGRSVVVVDDGPTLTHGGMPWGAGYVAAQATGARIVDPRPHAVGEMAAVFAAYPHIGPVLPAMGYSPAQIESLASSIRSAGAELVIAGTPVDLARLLDNEFPVVRARYDFADLDEPDGLWAEVERLIAAKGLE